jgi:hypothetical protein
MSTLYLTSPLGQQQCGICESFLTRDPPYINHLDANHGPVHAHELVQRLAVNSICPIIGCGVPIESSNGIYGTEMMARAALRAALVMEQRKTSLGNAAIAGGAALSALGMGAMTVALASKAIPAMLGGQPVIAIADSIISLLGGAAGSMMVGLSVNDVMRREVYGERTPVSSFSIAALSGICLLLTVKETSTAAAALVLGTAATAMAYLGLQLTNLHISDRVTIGSIYAGVFGGIIGGTIAIASDLSPLSILSISALAASAIAGAWSQMRMGRA